MARLSAPAALVLSLAATGCVFPKPNEFGLLASGFGEPGTHRVAIAVDYQRYYPGRGSIDLILLPTAKRDRPPRWLERSLRVYLLDADDGTAHRILRLERPADERPGDVSVSSRWLSDSFFLLLTGAYVTGSEDPGAHGIVRVWANGAFEWVDEIPAEARGFLFTPRSDLPPGRNTVAPAPGEAWGASEVR